MPPGEAEEIIDEMAGKTEMKLSKEIKIPVVVEADDDSIEIT
jgi:hypothetical protein